MKILGIVGAAALLAGCNWNNVQLADPGDETSETRSIGDFTSLSVGGPHKVTVTTGQAPSLTISGPEKMVEQTEISEENGELRIRQKDNQWNWRSGEVKVAIGVPAIEKATLGGSGVIAIDLIEGESFEGRVSGSGDLEIAELNARQASLSVTGSGDIKAAGSSDEVTIGVTGSGDVDSRDLVARTAKLTVTGSGDIRAHVTESADARVTGSGDIDVTGGATCTSKSSGSGDIHCD